MADDDTSRNADFVARVVKDAKSPPETRMLTGWLGDAPEEGERRLYTNADLSCYIDIPTDAILHTEPIRDSQPAGCVFVWVRRDAALKPGGSASSRAARFLQGQVQEDFASGASPEAEGYRCITQVPCGEPTGFTGRCTKQPVVGGAWPCITAIPHCAEPTGFTGKCTYQPWPNPTHYIGCTIYHCPTQDLTHIPHICNLVATGMPGCPVVSPPEEVDPAAKEHAEGAREGGAAEAVQPTPPVPLTAIPGCGYTRTWGLCPTLPQKCQVSVNIPCITQTETPQCRGIDLGIDLAAGGQFGAASQICATSIGCNITLLCPNAAFRAVGPGPVIPGTQAPCSAVDTCPTRIGCETKPPSVFCTQFSDACPTDPKFCPPTTVPQSCDTCCGPKCQTQPPLCTQCQCTQAGPQCPSAGAACPTFPPGCPSTNLQLDCTFGCTQLGTGCPATNLHLNCNPNVAAARAQAFRAAGPGGQTAALGCTQTGNNCLTIPDGDCTFFGGCQQTLATVCTQSGPQCPTHAQQHCTCAGPGCPPTPATVCTQAGPQCPTYPNGDCTFFGCPPPLTPVCARFAPGGGLSAVDACPTRICNTQQLCPSVACRKYTWYPCTLIAGCPAFPSLGCPPTFFCIE